LVKDSPKAGAGGVIVDDERLVEDGHLKNRPRGQGALERLKRGLILLRLGERVLAQRTRKSWVRGATIVPKLRMNLR
jgi:hypothetical protein